MTHRFPADEPHGDLDHVSGLQIQPAHGRFLMSWPDFESVTSHLTFSSAFLLPCGGRC